MKHLKRLSRRGLSLLICLIMCLGMLPGAAYAADLDEHDHDPHTEDAQSGETASVSAAALTADGGAISSPISGGAASKLPVAPVEPAEPEIGTLPGIGAGGSIGGGSTDGGSAGKGVSTGGTGRFPPVNPGDAEKAPCGHTAVLVPRIEATPEKHGQPYYVKCDICHEYWTDTSFSGQYGEEELILHYAGDLQVLEDGAEVVLCTVCGKELARNDPSTGEHTAHTWVQGDLVSEATCTAPAQYEFICTYEGCAETKVEKVGDKLGHDFSDPQYSNKTYHVYHCTRCTTQTGGREEHDWEEIWNVSASRISMTQFCKICHGEGRTATYQMSDLTLKEETPATCTEPGTAVYTYSPKRFTPYDITVVTPALGHDFGEYDYDDLGHSQACSRCDEVQPGEHTFDKTVLADPTCVDEGSVQYACGCGYVYEEPIDALGHAPVEDWTYGDDSHWRTCLHCGEPLETAEHAYTSAVLRAPTTETDGVRRYTCRVCARYYEAVIPAIVILSPADPSDDGAVDIDDLDTPLAGISFEDVLPNDPFYEAVQYVSDRGLMYGVSDTAFDPNGVLTRAALATSLYRLEGEPETASAAFSDVADGQWYTDAIGWITGNGILKGLSEELFGPLDAVTREQLAAALYGYAQLKGRDVTASADLSAYADASSISEDAVDAVSWALAAGVLAPVGETTLAPSAVATRAQMAQALMNFCEKYVPLEA